MTLRVNVLDINDNPPIFSKNEYVSNLNETLEVGTEFLQVFATDPDSGKNSRLTYHIVHPDNYASHFALHPDTGWMRTRASLRCRTKREVCVLKFTKIKVDSGEKTSSIFMEKISTSWVSF